MASKGRPFGPVLGERHLHTRGAATRRVTVTLGKPRRMTDHPDWECPFQIRGLGRTRIAYGHGVDALQALTTALWGIRVALDESKVPLGWTGGLDDHSGFHHLVPIGPAPRFERRYQRAVDCESRRILTELRAKRRLRARPR
jgi:hypothetical protein